MEVFKIVILIILVSICAYTDIKQKKIYNKFLVIPLILGFVISVYTLGLDGFRSSFIGMIVPFLMFIIFFAMHLFGAGDIKLYCTIGAIMGWKFVVNNIFFSFILTGIIIIIRVLYKRQFLMYIKNIYFYFKTFFISKGDMSSDKKIETSYFPFAISIFVSTIVQLMSGYNFI